ncbi:MAG: hypothetical protein AAGD11_07570 [Planctomycetota bacterium]
MQAPSPNRPPAKRKLPVLWIAVGTLIAILGLFLFQLFGPNPPIVVSKQTTFITEPLGEDGLPDYEAYLLERGSEGVTPENNAAVPFWKAMWPGLLEQEDWLPLCNALGIPKIATNRQPLGDPYDEAVRRLFTVDYAKHLASTLSEESDSENFLSDEWQSKLSELSTQQIVDFAINRPWSGEQLPSVADWVNDRASSYDLLIESGRRQVYHSPSPTLLNGSPDLLWAVLLPDVQMHRYAAKVLKLRAMLLAGEDRGWDSWRNLLAAHSLARHSTQTTGSSLVAHITGITIETHACQGTQAILHSCAFTEEQLLTILNDLNDLPKISNCADAIDKGERLFFADSGLYLAAANPEEVANFMGDDHGSLAKVARTRIDWNQVLRMGNLYYDKLVSAMKLSDRFARQSKLQTIESELIAEMKAESASQTSLNLKLSMAKRSKAIGFILIAHLAPAAEAASNAEDRAYTQLELTKLAAALAVYRAEQGEYPEKLEQLVPSVIPKLPIDLYSGESFLYQRKEDGGYLLYSVYENGIDDGGADVSGEIIDGEYVDEAPADFDEQSSDLVVRVPVPAFKFPELPSVEESDEE